MREVRNHGAIAMVGPHIGLITNEKKFSNVINPISKRNENVSTIVSSFVKVRSFSSKTRNEDDASRFTGPGSSTGTALLGNGWN
jgi:hypothetical protein